jgi:hypothetical protein
MLILEGPAGAGVASSPDGEGPASAGMDGTVKIRDARLMDEPPSVSAER